MNQLEFLSQFSNAVLSGEKVSYGHHKNQSNPHIQPTFPFSEKWHKAWLNKQIESGVFQNSNAVLGGAS
jgi:hypothetical protein